MNGISLYSNGGAGQDFEIGVDSIVLVDRVTFEQLEINGSVNSFISLEGNEIDVLLDVNPDDLNADSFIEI